MVCGFKIIEYGWLLIGPSVHEANLPPKGERQQRQQPPNHRHPYPAEDSDLIVLRVDFDFSNLQ